MQLSEIKAQVLAFHSREWVRQFGDLRQISTWVSAHAVASEWLAASLCDD